MEERICTKKLSDLVKSMLFSGVYIYRVTKGNADVYQACNDVKTQRAFEKEGCEEKWSLKSHSELIEIPLL